MNIRILLVLISIVIFGLVGCEKDNSTTWNFCQECTAPFWTGSYSGYGDYYYGKDSAQYLNVDTQLEITQLGGNVLKFDVVAPDYYQTSFTTSKDDNEYYINIPGSNKSLIVNLTQNGNQNRITGVTKVYHWVYWPDTVLVIDHSLSFEVLSSTE